MHADQAQGLHRCPRGVVPSFPHPPGSSRMMQQVPRTEVCCPEPMAAEAGLGLEPTSVVEDLSGCVKIVGSDLRDLLQVPAQPLKGEVVWGNLLNFWVSFLSFKTIT